MFVCTCFYGYERQMLVFNGSYPGPRLEANWGDMLVILVTNELTNNGTAVHWHGIRQQGSNQYDVPGLSDGLYGLHIIHGPATADYDVDLGPIFMTDLYHQSAFILWAQSGMYGGFPVRHNAVAPNGLINGTNTFPCDDSDDPACLGTGKCSETVVQKGKKYRLRLLDAQADGWMQFSIDGHKPTVIAADLVPIVPYRTDSVILTSGQRYDVIFEANQDIGTIRYEGASQVDPTFENDNPGSWLMHCHISWHTSESLALQFVEHQSEVPELLASVSADFELTCAKWETYYKSSLHK
ncbi:unnamed protein product [Penicillium nalgiovense]|nr:unnamed protein product [Penicillium nalgiovense]